jgi:hypothetical protein
LHAKAREHQPYYDQRWMFLNGTVASSSLF